jgi:hypothetical protein
VPEHYAPAVIDAAGDGQRDVAGPGLVPHVAPKVHDAIAEAARDLDGLRTGWLNPPGLSEADLAKRTLTNLYNARPTWLAQAHERLDAAVLAAYDWAADIDREALLARLLALNLARAQHGTETD